MQRGLGDSNPPSFRGRRPWNPLFRGTRPTVDAGDPRFPSFRGRAVAVESPRQGQGSTSSLPLLNHPGDSRAERENDVHNGDCVPGPNRGCGRVALSSVILAKRGSPGQGQRSTSSLPFRNHLGDSRAERENDSNIFRAVVVTCTNQLGDSSPAYAGSE